VSRRTWFLRLFGLGISASSPLRLKNAVAMMQNRAGTAAAADKLGISKPAVSSSLEAVRNGITPVDQFFVRSHFDVPQTSMDDWKLRIEGKVAHPMELTFSDLLIAPTQKLEAVLECSGNVQLLVSNGVWEGVPLSFLLSQASPNSEAQNVMLEGADVGPLLENSSGYPFTRIVPLQKCLTSETLLAFRLNGQFLPPRNGFPVRALLPGWYAMDSVKWLRRIVVLGPEDRPEGFYASGMNSLYSRVTAEAGERRISSRVSEILVRSNIAFPSPEANLAAGTYTVWGFAWTGTDRVADVTVSSDSGKMWNTATLEGGSKPFTWVKWTYKWTASPGEHKLMSRARDTGGNTQPLTRDPLRLDGYEANWCRPVNCSVR
jgi:DMSO/TMAO reductase YedYZ molybdopterin-dependent catalytic subunit